MSSLRQNRAKDSENLNLSTASTDSSGDSTCVVCFRNVEIFSIGECDHPVCYECSTRMRVLCQQNECPICRQGMSKVIFTNEKRSYRDLEANNRSEYYNKKYKICFANIQIQKAFYNLLEHPCPRCDVQPFSCFDTLKDHVRKEHELFYCDICTDNLKIFSFERKCYTRQALGMHRRKGDPDNTSHRGHPLCQYCDCRYLDRDELFRHLRREHYYCHICDAGGANQFYGNLESLVEHFRKEHYFCEEPQCAQEPLTAVHPSEIDYRAHVANVHGKSMGKQQAKQARTLQLEIRVGPRGRGQPDFTSAQLRSRGNNEFADEFEHSEPAQPVQNMRMIDARSEQDFPSLGRTAPTVTLVHPNMSIRAKTFGPAGLARTKENFPALGGGGNSVSDTVPGLPNSSSQYNRPVSAIVKSQNVPQSAKPNSSMVIHVSNRPNNSANQVPKEKDFPALPGNARSQASHNMLPMPTSSFPALALSTNKNRSQTGDISRPYSKPSQTQTNNKSAATARRIEEDFIPPTSSYDLHSIAAKHRSLVDDYVSAAVQPNSKLALVQKQEARSSKNDNNPSNKPKLNSNDFPALAATSTLGAAEASWVKTPKQQDRENRKSKVAPAPLLPSSNDHSNTKKNNEKKDNNKNNNNNQKKQNKANEKKPTTTKANETAQSGAKQSKEKKSSPDNNNELKVTNRNKEKNKDNDTKNRNGERTPPSPTTSTTSSSSIPPPGFGRSNQTTAPPPPGFKSVTLNSIAKPTNNLTFTNSLGENFSIVPTHQYFPPPDSTRRNQELVRHFENALKSNEALAEFRYISQKFREGVYKPLAFYEHCQAALRDKFDDIFPELLVLLPDISKQQGLYLIYSQHLNSLFATAKQQQIKAMLSVCEICKQIIIKYDLMSHMLAHNLESDFPSLSNASSTAV